MINSRTRFFLSFIIFFFHEIQSHIFQFYQFNIYLTPNQPIMYQVNNDNEISNLYLNRNGYFHLIPDRETAIRLDIEFYNITTISLSDLEKNYVLGTTLKSLNTKILSPDDVMNMHLQKIKILQGFILKNFTGLGSIPSKYHILFQIILF